MSTGDKFVTAVSNLYVSSVYLSAPGIKNQKKKEEELTVNHGTPTGTILDLEAIYLFISLLTLPGRILTWIAEQRSFIGDHKQEE